MTAGLIYHLIDASHDTAYFRAIVRRADNARFPVTIGSLAPAGPLQAALRELGGRTFSLGATSRFSYPTAVLSLGHRLRRDRASVLHAHCFDPTIVGLFAARLAGCRFVFTRHHSDHNIRLGKRWHSKVDGWCGRVADRVIAVSEATRRIMIDAEGVPDERVVVVFNGIEPVSQPSTEAIARLRAELGVGSRPVCLMAARLHEEKGHHVLIQALPKVLARVPALMTLLAGDGPHRSNLEARVRARGLADRVRFLARRDDIPDLIGLSSVVVLPSLAESFGFAALEAMSLAKPVVVSSAGGLPEIVMDGECGLVVPRGDADALSAALCRVLEDPVLARALGTAGALRAGLFTADRMMRGYERVYETLA